jgi:hypothetical protein
MIREVRPEQIRATVVEYLNNVVLNYGDVMKFWEIMENKPMVEKERQKYDRTISHITDNMFMKRIFFEKYFGEDIAKAIDKSFKDMYQEGKLQGGRECARRMMNDGMTVELIAKYTGLIAEEIEGL